MKIIRVVSCILILSACGKSNHDSGSNHSYFKDIIFNETVGRGGQPFQHALGYFQLSSDPATQIMVASLGSEEYADAWGFRIVGINKASGTINWVKAYELPSQYTIQIATCAVMDRNENIWVGGHCFNGTNIGQFLVKLDKQGNILWSNLFSNYWGWRAYSLVALSNGDIAFLTKAEPGMVVHRLTSSGQPVWSVMALCNYPAAIDNDYYNGAPALAGPEDHGVVETSDGSIFFGSSSNASANGVGGVDRLVRLNANGDSVFAKTYSVAGNKAPVRPLQLINAGDDKLLMVDNAFSNIAPQLGPAQYFSFLSMDGSVTASSIRSIGNTGLGTFNLNEVKVYNGNVYFSTCGGYEFDTYVLDQSLHVRSSVKTAAATDIGTDRGGISLYDPNDQALYYIFNFGGNPGESNGFEITRNGSDGKPCVGTYSNPPQTLTLTDNHISIATDTEIAISKGITPTFTTLTWNTPVVSIKATEAVCGQ